MAPEVRSQELGKKKSFGTQGNTIHEFEGTRWEFLLTSQMVWLERAVEI